jgi:hypothetical protein
VKGKLLLVLLLSGRLLLSQQLSHQVMLPAAGVIYSSGISYSQTVGETAVEIFSSTDYLLTQGFQQPRMVMLPGVPPKGTGVKAYPNPAVDFLNLELFGEFGKNLRITLTNISGTVVYSTDVSFAEKYWYIQEIPISGFSTGLYFVQVISSDGTLRRSFKIEKL